MLEVGRPEVDRLETRLVRNEPVINELAGVRRSMAEAQGKSGAGGRRRRRYLVLKGGGRKGLSTKTDKSSLPYKTPWNFYREGMKLPVFV
mgnify:CR=1 FL=1